MMFLIRCWKLALAAAILLVTSCNPAATTPLPQAEEAATVSPTSIPTLTAIPGGGIPGYTKTTLEIERGGKIYSILLGYDIGDAHFRRTPAPDYDIDQLYGDHLNIQLANLEWISDADQDGEQEYFLSVLGRGAFGYYILLAVDYDPSSDEYRIFDQTGFRASCFDDWDDLEKDGIPEIMARDEGYHDAFGGGADSVFSPLLILRYNGQKFVEVTREYPDRLEKDAEEWLAAIESDADGQGKFPSIYAAYLADMARLDKREEGTRIYSEKCKEHLYPDSSNTAQNCDTLLERINKAIDEKW